MRNYLNIINKLIYYILQQVIEQIYFTNIYYNLIYNYYNLKFSKQLYIQIQDNKIYTKIVMLRFMQKPLQ